MNSTVIFPVYFSVGSGHTGAGLAVSGEETEDAFPQSSLRR